METGEPVTIQSPQHTEDLAQAADAQQRESEEGSGAAKEKAKMTAEEAQKEVQKLKATLLRQLRVVLMAGECHAQLGNLKEVDALVEQIVSAVQTAKAVSVMDLVKQAVVFTDEKDFIQALITMQCICKLFVAEKFPHEALFDLAEWMQKIDDLYSEASDKKYRSLHAFCKLDIHFMDQIAEQLSDLEDVLEDLRVKVKVRCLGNKADCLSAIDREDEALEVYGECVDAMRQQYGDNASANRYFSEFLNNIGHVYVRRQQFIMAQSYFEESLAARVMAQDFDTEAEKQKYIASTSSVLSQVEQLAARQQAEEWSKPPDAESQAGTSS